ncbi:MAG: hypothetical protein E6G97_22000 [Alphaproteobacteria bacterium]|nr:MAG: hypothetical protein E6G97_22000 [Alphaproteobacteria bacterium]
MAKLRIKSDSRTITVRVPILIRKRGGRKLVLAPEGLQHDARMLRCQQVDSAMVKALARAFRWRELLENGMYSTIKEIADGEKIAETYIGRVLRLNLLAPDIIELILIGPHPPSLTLPALMKKRFPATWSDQRKVFGTQPFRKRASV